MNIAIYHGFTDIHYEMLGYFIEYMKYSNINFNIYALSTNKTGLEWYNFYCKKFNLLLEWKNPSLFNPYIYNFIILLTDDDLSFKNEWLVEFGKEKVICIDHHCTIRREYEMLYRIGTRFFYNRPYLDWIIPCYYGITKNNKEIILNQSSKIKVLCIGVQNTPLDINFLKDLFDNFNEIEFHIAARIIQNKFENFLNIFIYEMCETELLFEHVYTSQYILCINRIDNYHPASNSISGAIPIAFSYGCQLILPELWQKYYNFKSIISYKDNYVQKNGTTKLILSKNINLNNIYNELNELVLNRNIILDKIFKYKNINDNNIWYSSILNILNYSYPNIYISVSNNLDQDKILNLQKIFRKIYLINNDLPFINDYIINIDIDYINKINTCIFIEINNILENYDIVQKILTILSNRHFQDIILLNNINNFIEYYTRYNICYNYDNKLIMIPQK
jgi:hypothetical protein